MRKNKKDLSQETFDFFPAVGEWPIGYYKDLNNLGQFWHKTVKGMDIETKGLNPYDAKVMILSVGVSPEHGISFSSYCRNGWNEMDLERFKMELENPNNILCGQNIKYDINWIAIKTGINVKAMLFDIQFAQYLLDENDRTNSLEGNIKRAYISNPEMFEDLKDYKSLVDRDNLDGQHKDDLLLYNNRDADASKRLYNYYVPKLIEGGYDKLMGTASLVLPVLSKMETRGVYLDKEWALKTQDKLFTDLVKLRYSMCEIAKTSFKPESPQQLASVLFGKLRFTPTNYTDSGQASTTSEAMGYLVDQAVTEDQNKFLDAIIQYKKQMKLLTTYYQPIERWTKYDGRVHANYSLGRYETEEGSGGTVTGRLSCREPNLQNIPRGKEHRGMFRATDGYTLLDGDFCISPDTRILTANLEWRFARELTEGEELIGFDEYGLVNNPRKFRSSIIQRLERKKLPCLEIQTDKGKTVVSEEHSFLVMCSLSSGGYGLRWIKAKDLIVGAQIGYVCDTWSFDETREAGYVAGFMDGEGWCSDTVVGFGQNPNKALTEVLKNINKLGYAFKLSSTRNKSGLEQWRICGLTNTWKFIGSIRPARLLENSRCLWENRRTWSMERRVATVLDIKHIGVQEVVALQTSTKTFISDGMLSHNSQLELRVAAFLSQEPVMMEAFENNLDIHTAVMSDLTGMPYDEIEARRNKDEKVKNDRVAIKRVNFGILYGVQARRLQRLLRIELGINQELAYCKELIRKWLSRYSKVADWLNTQKVQAVAYKYVRMPLGQSRRLPEASFDRTKEAAHALSQATNFPIQSFASWICLIGLILLQGYIDTHTHLFEAFIIMQVHDSVTMEVKLISNLVTLENIKVDVKKIMEVETLNYIRNVFGINFNVPLVFDIELKERWS